MSYLYKYVLGDQIIYVGIASVLKRRIQKHGKQGDNIPESFWEDIKKADVYYAEVDTTEIAQLYEADLVNKYNPKYNKNKRNIIGSFLPEPQWKKYSENSDLTVEQDVQQEYFSGTGKDVPSQDDRETVKRLMSEIKELRSMLLDETERRLELEKEKCAIERKKLLGCA